jgi:hypothetical protein
MAAASPKIIPQKNEFDDHILDVFGNAFKFDHAKGLAEWIKNSADAYSTTAGVKDDEQYIFLRFKPGNPKRLSIFECIDFVGMTKHDVDKAVKVWGLPTAAKKGTNLPTFGGHGNGGKFYMRQMFESSRFITYRNGKLNVFGFDEKRHYGFAKGLEDKEMTLPEALKFAGIDSIDIPANVIKRWKSSKTKAGFTVVVGEHPKVFSGRATVQTILERLTVHPQARRLLRHKEVFALLWGQKSGARLEPPTIPTREGFEKPREIKLPKTFDYNGEQHEFRSKKYPDGKLVLYTSDRPLTRSGELADLNGIDILGEVGCIGSYRMNELGFMKNAAESEFVYGECEAPFLEEEGVNSVTNDREKLVENDLTKALVSWIRQQVDVLSGEMAEKQRSEQKSRDLRQSSLFNQLLDRWKNKFMAKLTSELFGGKGIGDSFGGAGAGGDSKVSKGANGSGNSSDRQNEGESGDQGGGTGNESRKGPKFPRVLLSGHDPDPLDPNATGPFECDERNPPVYQRDLDIDQGIYWINTSRPLARKLMDQCGSGSARWREYLFQRYVDIILKQAIYELGKHDPDLRPYKIDGLIDDVTSRVHDAAAEDLESFLFDESLKGSAPMPVVSEGMDGMGVAPESIA